MDKMEWYVVWNKGDLTPQIVQGGAEETFSFGRKLPEEFNEIVNSLFVISEFTKDEETLLRELALVVLRNKETLVIENSFFIALNNDEVTKKSLKCGDFKRALGSLTNIKNLILEPDIFDDCIVLTIKLNKYE